MFEKLNRQTSAVKLENAKDVLEQNFFIKLKEIEPSLMLDHSIFGYFDRCHLVNSVLSEDCFLFEIL